MAGEEEKEKENPEPFLAGIYGTAIAYSAGAEITGPAYDAAYALSVRATAWLLTLQRRSSSVGTAAAAVSSSDEERELIDENLTDGELASTQIPGGAEYGLPAARHGRSQLGAITTPFTAAHLPVRGLRPGWRHRIVSIAAAAPSSYIQ